MPPFLDFFIHGATLLVLLKIGIIATLFLFIFFLIVVLKQVQSMNAIVTEPVLFPFLQGFVYVLIAITIALFIASIVIL